MGLRQRTPRASHLRRLIGTVLLLDLFVTGIVVVYLLHARRQYAARAASSVENLSLVLERDIAGIVDRVSLALSVIADEHERLGARGHPADDGPAMSAFLRRLGARLPEVDALRLADAEGAVVCGTDVSEPGLVHVEDRPHFRRLREDPTLELAVSPPQISRVNGKGVVVFARRLRRPDGGFGGMVYAPVTLQRFSQELSSIDVGARGSISLRDRELRILARHPTPPDEVIGRPLAVPELQALVDSGGRDASYVTGHTVDGVVRRFSVRRVADLPLYVVVGRSIEEDIESWRREAAWSLGLLLVYCAVTGVGARLVDRAWVRQVAAAEEIQALNAALERRVAERTAALELANKEMEEFSYSVSHNLRSPLRAIVGFAQILSEDYGARLDEEGRRLLTVVRTNGLRMGQLIDGILDFLSLGRQVLRPTDLDLGALAREAFEGVRPTDRAPAFDVGPMPPARGDADLVLLALANLLSNAVKFTAQRTDARIEVGGTAGERENTYYVRDNGVGFDMRYATKLFRVFERLHDEPELAGMGVGLASVQRIVHRHGGHLWAAGEVGRGATFYFTLPPASGYRPA